MTLPPDAAPGTVLILGANGRFGRHAVTAFRHGGWRVRALLRPGRAAPDGVKAVFADAADTRALTAAARGAEVIVNALNPPYPDWAEAVPRLVVSVIAAAKACGATVLIPGNVYNYGRELPALVREPAPDHGDHPKARIRCDMEAAYRAAAAEGVRTIILRGGDFLDDRDSGGWFDHYIAAGIGKGRARYPGPLDRIHAWAYLPDMTRAAELLARRRADLPAFATLGFGGHALTGAELIAAMGRAAGRDLRPGSFPWPALRIAAPFSPMIREVLAMRYLWNRPHRIDGAPLARLLTDFHPTPTDQAIRRCLEGAGRIGVRAAMPAPRSTPAPSRA